MVEYSNKPGAAFFSHKSDEHQSDLSDLLKIVKKVDADAPDWVQELIQASTVSAILKYQPPISTGLQRLQRMNLG